AARRSDPVTGVALSPQLRAGRGYVVARRGTRVAAVPADYAVGSGHHGITYLSCSRGGTLELRLSYYSAGRGWDFSPRQPPGAPRATPLGRPVSLAEEKECFGCHSTVFMTTEGRVAPEPSLLSIGCERCHGPGRAHLEALRRGDRNLRMARLAGSRKEVTMTLC